MANKFSNITTLTTTVVADRKCVLSKVIINKAGTTDTLTIYDHASLASGTKVGTITAVAGAVYEYNALMKNGITIVSAGGAAGDYTVLWS